MQKKKMQVMFKLFVLLGGSLLVMILLIGVSLSQVRESMIKEREATLKKLVESALSLSKYQYLRAEAGEFSVDEAKVRVRNLIRSMRYGDGGYLFAVDKAGRMEAHPIFPDFEGKDQIEMRDLRGTPIIQNVLKLAETGGGYSYYYFKKPAHGDEIFPKLTYSQTFEPWGWVFATGIYVDDVDTAFHEQIKTWAQIVIVPFLFLFLVTYYLGVQIARPMFQLEKAKQSAETATRAKSDFLANMSHEIRTPLNGAMGMLALLLGTKMTTQQREWTQIAYQSSEELLNLINDILDVSKVEAGHMTLESLPFDLQANIKEVTDLLYPRVHRKGVELLVSLRPDMPRMVVGDPVRLRQILLNLVGNAIKFTSQGYIMISVAGEARGDDYFMTFEVKDTGIGIPDDKQAYVFEKFAQAEESTTRNFGGTGLGLVICRKLTALMGGEVGVRSVLGQGSTFWFTVRFKQALEPEAMVSAPLTQKAARILLKLSHEAICSQTREYLLRFGFSCDVVTAAQDTVAVLRQAVALEGPYAYLFIETEAFPDDLEEMSVGLKDMDIASPTTQIILVASPDQPISTERLVLRRSVGVLIKPIFPQDAYDIIHLLSDKVRQGEVYQGGARLVLAREGQLGWEEDPLPLPAQTETSKAAEKEGKTILIVEDQAINQMLMKTLIKQYGHAFDVASNGIEAVKLAAEKRYDLIFMDCHMPEMDGFEATKQIRAFESRLQRHTPIIALTADAMIGDREKCLDAGMDDYMHKPIKPAIIKEMIAKHIHESSG